MNTEKIRTKLQAPLLSVMRSWPTEKRASRRRRMQVLAALALLAVGFFGGWLVARSPSRVEASALRPEPFFEQVRQPDPPSSEPAPFSGQRPDPLPVAPSPRASPSSPPEHPQRCHYVRDGSGLTARGDVDMSLEWAFADAGLTWNGQPLTDSGGPWDLWLERQRLGRLATSNLSAVPRIVPAELRDSANRLVIAQVAGPRFYACNPVVPNQWGTKTLEDGVLIRCVGDDGTELRLATCLADPRPPGARMIRPLPPPSPAPPRSTFTPLFRLPGAVPQAPGPQADQPKELR